MRRFRSAWVLVALVLALAVATQAAADEAPAEKRPIYVEVCVVEIDVAKLKAVGFEWEALYKTFLATWLPVGSLIRVGRVDENHGGQGFFRH